MPTPISSRPPEKWSSVAICFAVTTMSRRIGSTRIPVPKRSVVVSDATKE